MITKLTQKGKNRSPNSRISDTNTKNSNNPTKQQKPKIQKLSTQIITYREFKKAQKFLTFHDLRETKTSEVKYELQQESTGSNFLVVFYSPLMVNLLYYEAFGSQLCYAKKKPRSMRGVSAHNTCINRYNTDRKTYWANFI